MTFPLWVSIALWAGGICGAGALAYFFVIRPIADWGASKEREANLNADKQELQNENDRLNNRPRTMSDRIARLQAWKRKIK